jgi:hypothetical protein
MVWRFVWIVLAAAAMMASAHAADLVALPSAGCCGSAMITIYGFEPCS